MTAVTFKNSSRMRLTVTLMFTLLGSRPALATISMFAGAGTRPKRIRRNTSLPMFTLEETFLELPISTGLDKLLCILLVKTLSVTWTLEKYYLNKRLSASSCL
ncbi:hypothetical protein BKA70DRAFT_1331185 [Coprinopsis sp. MPI-PUGE-AT-0042]|nr:hypothetical protein BKA70DRAFT_1331185 [Coprinopsis sp. MPI-PUGE-AT-0042]